MSDESSLSFRVGQVPVDVFDDKRDLGRAAAADAATIMIEAIEARQQARVIVGTGNSQDEVIDELTKQPGINWSAVEAFHMDEYIGIPNTHSASFRRWLKTRLADVVHPAAAHYLNGDAPDLDAECNRYGDLLSSAPIDICFIGFGENGHIAFNDPHVADFEDPRAIKCVDMDEACRRQQAGEGHFENLEAVPREAMTLTCPTLLAATHLIACVPDLRKAQAVKRALEGLSTDCPASAVFKHPRAHVYLDTQSASFLSDEQKQMR